jgi:hypothetical protein
MIELKAARFASALKLAWAAVSSDCGAGALLTSSLAVASVVMC